MKGNDETFSSDLENFRSWIERVKDLDWVEGDSSSSGRSDEEGVAGCGFGRFVVQQPIIFIYDWVWFWLEGYFGFGLKGNFFIEHFKPRKLLNEFSKGIKTTY